MMKILMLNNEFPPLGGGTGTVNAELFKQLKNEKNIRIDLITSTTGKKKEYEQFSDNIHIYKYPVNNRNIHHSSNPELIKYSLKAFFALIFRFRKRKYDLCMAWSTVPAGFVAFLFKILTKTPYFVRVGGPDIPGFEDRYKNVYRIISPVIRMIWKKAEFLLAKCRTEKEMIHKINPKLNVRIIYNGVDTKKFLPAEKASNYPFRIICPARLIHRKGQDILIKAVARLKQKGIIYHVDLVGEGDAKSEFKALAEQLGVADEINFCGYISRKQMPSYYARSDIFVLPSRNEGMSNALLEALASGLPAVVTDVGGSEELINEQNGFVFEKDNISELVQVLANIDSNPKLLDAASKYARLKAEEHDRRKIAKQYYDIFSRFA